MSLAISQVGGMLLFANLTPLSNTQVAENLGQLWDLAPAVRLETLASAYQHLSRLPEANPDLLERVGEMIQRYEKGEEAAPADSFILSRLIGEWANLKDSVPPSKPPSKPASAPPFEDSVVIRDRETPSSARLRRRETESSLIFYTEGQGQMYPSSWVHFSKDMRDALKILNLGRSGKMVDLMEGDDIHAEFLAGAVAEWIEEIKTRVTETGTKGVGASGLASPPAVDGTIALIAEMAEKMGTVEALQTVAPLFWELFGRNGDLRGAIGRLRTMRTARARLLTEEQSARLERALLTLDAAFVRFLLLPLFPSESDLPEGVASAETQDGERGEFLAQDLSDFLAGLPAGCRAPLSAGEQVALSNAESTLRLLRRAIAASSKAPILEGFLNKLFPGDMFKLPALVAMIREHRRSKDQDS